MIKTIYRSLSAIYKILLVFAIVINASDRSSKNQADQIIKDICEKLYEENSPSVENEKWHKLCEDWTKTKDLQQYDDTQDEQILDAQHTINMIQSAKARGGGSRGGSGGSRISGSRVSGGGSRVTSSISRYRNVRTGTSISRPNGWLWSRSRYIFLPLATQFFHRSRSSTNRYTTPASTILTYYYCTSSDDSVEIQCSSANGDSKCCEYESQPYCCGGEIPDDFVEDPNQATRRLTQIFYTLAAVTLCMHFFLRRFRQ